jgi:hypothetical protein
MKPEDVVEDVEKDNVEVKDKIKFKVKVVLLLPLLAPSLTNNGKVSPFSTFPPLSPLTSNFHHPETYPSIPALNPNLGF